MAVDEAEAVDGAPARTPTPARSVLQAGKGETVEDATLKASLRAVKRMQSFNRCGDRTLPHRIYRKVGATKLHLWPLPAGTLAVLFGRRGILSERSELSEFASCVRALGGG